MKLTHNQNEILNTLIQQTGLTERRCKNFCERYNWNEEKIYNDSVIKASVAHYKVFDEETNTKSKKTRQKGQKEPQIESIRNVRTITSSTGVEFEVETVHGTDIFNGKTLSNDSAAFYLPYASMQEINDWTQKYLKKR